MDLYLLRHADALPAGAPGIRTDDERPLSETGRKESRDVGAALRKLGVGPETVLSSPLLRARQTAELVTGALGGLRVTVCEELGHAFSSPALLAKLCELPGRQAVLLVGHQPDLGTFASFLLSGREGIDVGLKKAGLCRIEFEGLPAVGRGTLRWLLTQKHLAMMAA